MTEDSRVKTGKIIVDHQKIMRKKKLIEALFERNMKTIVEEHVSLIMKQLYTIN